MASRRFLTSCRQARIGSFRWPYEKGADDAYRLTRAMGRRRTMDPASLRSLAGRQWRDYQWGTPGTMFTDPEISLTLDEAYQIQMEFAGLRCAAGDAVAGYKVGCIGTGVVEQFGMSGAIHARLFRSEIHSSSETLRYRAYANPAIEGEMALRIGIDGRIAAAFPVIELHQFLFRARGRRLPNSSPTTASTPAR